jgi:hypothetical protein
MGHAGKDVADDYGRYDLNALAENDGDASAGAGGRQSVKTALEYGERP